MARLSISLTDSLAKFVDQYGKTHGLKRSKVFEEAVKLLRNRELEGAYTEWFGIGQDLGEHNRGRPRP